MTNYSFIIIDNEYSIRNILENLLLNYFPNISILDKNDSLFDGVKSIEN